MNQTELIAEIRRLMAETTAAASYASDTDIKKWINDGIKDICIKGMQFEKTSTTDVLNGIAAYTLPVDFIRLISFRDPNGIALDMIDPGVLGRYYLISGKPLYYYTTQTRLTPTTRANSTYYPASTILIPATPNGYLYEVTTAGTTGGSPPTYPTNEGETVVDGTATLTCRDFMTYIWSIVLVDTPTTAGGGTGTYTLTYNGTAPSLINGTDAPQFPVDKHRSLIAYGCYRWCIKTRDAQLGMSFYQEYAAGAGLPTMGQEGKQSATS